VKNVSSRLLQRLWRTARPWLIPLGFVMLLRFTGVLSVISQLSGSLLLKTGLLNASMDAPPVMHKFSYDFTLQDLDGRIVDASQLREKTLFVNVWATWCGPCRIEMPAIDALYKDVDTSRVAFLMISVDDEGDLGKVKSFVSDKGFSFPVYRAAGILPELLHVRSIPTTFVVRPDGMIIVRESGLTNYNTKAVKALLEAR
jgi:thiol-disulfide isomerase/thioredoxin